MLRKTNALKIFFSFLLLALCAFSKLSYADWSVGVSMGGPSDYHDDYRYNRWHDHPHYGYHIHYLPDGCFRTWVGGVEYSYYDGLYYTYVGHGDYVLVEPPVGAYVNVIPSDFQAVSINGRVYYTDNGVYYILTEHHGYKVVPQPVVYAEPVQQVVVEQAPAPVVSQDAFPVNVPNNSGGYTAVLIKRSGNGYVGPQGEFYASFPSVAQLKAMYGK